MATVITPSKIRPCAASTNATPAQTLARYAAMNSMSITQAVIDFETIRGLSFTNSQVAEAMELMKA